MSDRWITTQVAPLPVPGLMARNMPIVAFLLQHLDGDPTETRAVAAVLFQGVLHPADTVPTDYEGEWKKITD